MRGAFERRSRKNTRHQQDDECRDTEPGKPIAGACIKSCFAHQIYFSINRHKTAGHCRGLSQDPTAVVGESQEAIAPRPSKRKTVLDRAQDGHARMQPAVEVKVPGGDQQQVRPSPAYSRLRSGQSRSLQICNPQRPDGWSTTTRVLPGFSRSTPGKR